MAELERLHGGRKDAPALIFIHGLGGHPKDSWRYDECQPDDFWLHWVGRDTGCDVWTLAYDAALSAWTEQAMPLPDQGSHIMDRLSTIHELQNKSLILVGHSMGGLVIKTMLTYGLHEDPRFKGLARRIQGIVFIATPHGGAQLASLFEAIKIVSRANPQVGDLSKHDHHLDSLNRRFLNSVSELGIKVRIFAEKRGVTSKRRWFRWFRGPSVLVVDRHSANPGVPDCLPINLPEDHFSICKPKDRNAQIHASVCAFVKTIAAAPVERPHVPPTDNVELQRYPGQLSGPGDNLLQPRDGRFYGRDDEVKQVLAFLRGTESASMVSTLVGGVGGAGKTEVCKAALKSWLAERSDARAFYVEVPDGAGLGVFIAQIGGAIGKPDCATPQELLAIIPPGLWYLDNLEGIADDKAARGLLGAMRNKDGVRLLASSRTMLNNIFGTPIKINQLPEGSALRLFRELWGGEGGQLPDDQALARFVIGKLGAHALSITLMARLGNSRSYAALVRDWEALGTDIVDDGLDADDRQGSLNVSLRLTANALASIPGALHLWTLVALFDDGVSESDLEKLETRGEWTRAARQRLADHNVLFQRDGRWHVLPPLARYALRAAQKDQDGFSWPLARKPAQDLFIEMAEQASAIKSNSANLHARGFIISHFSTVANLITHEINSQTRDNNWILQINRRLTNLYQFRIALSYPLLCKLVDAGLGEANMFQSLGDLERLLGQVDAARRRYDAALVLCRQEQDRLGEANTLRCLGDLEFRLGQVDAARQRYDAALVLFR
ncbi:alpha/beta fold hydrolase, partial [Niveispirillum irakense]|uniref:alpha/beta fold hydrolase n=1 Tax=Niveispirillum irakense TaxID=34011 RepID=UPI000557D65A